MIGPIFRAPNLSEAWLNAITHVRDRGPAFHLGVQIEDMTGEDTGIRRRVDPFLDESDFASVSTVRNTIFPKTDARFARGDVATLVKRYRSTYDQTRKFRGNRGGTYFGRIVAAKPSRDGATYDQLSDAIAKLREPGVNETRTEIDLAEIDEIEGSAIVGIYQTESDARKRMGFPCLSHLAFQRDGDALHAFAYYRNQDLGRKAYGNYLGLAQLAAYIAGHAGLRPSMLTVMAGRAVLGGRARLLDQLVLGR